MWIQFLRHKRIAAKGSTQGQGEEGKAFERNPFAQIGWPPLASAIGMSLAIKKFCTAKKKETKRQKKFATRRWCKCAAVLCDFFPLCPENETAMCEKIARALSIVVEDRKIEVQFIRIENGRCMNRPKKEENR